MRQLYRVGTLYFSGYVFFKDDKPNCKNKIKQLGHNINYLNNEVMLLIIKQLLPRRQNKLLKTSKDS